MRLLEHAPTQRNDQAGVLGERDEVAGRNEAELGVVPAHERFERDRQPGTDVDDRLVVDDQLVALERAVQSGDARQSVRGVGCFAVGLVLDAAPAALLGAVHRVVGFAQQLGRVGLVARDRDADARAHEQGLGVDLERLLQDRRDAIDRGVHLEVVLHVFDDDDELVTAEPRDRVGRAQPVDHALRDLGEQTVAGVVTEAVVDELEPVEVEEEHGHRGLVAARALQRVGQAVVQQRAVRQSGQLVVVRAVLEVFAGAGLFDRNRGERDDPFEQRSMAVAVDVVVIEEQRERARDGVAVRQLDRHGPADRMPSSIATSLTRSESVVA